MQAKLIIAFEHDGEATFLSRVESIAAALTANPHFPEPWPAPLPGLAKLAADVAAYQAAYNAAKDGDRQKIAAREAVRKLVSSDLKMLAPYLEMIANGDVAALISTAYPLRRPSVRGSAANADVPLPPEDFRVTRGTLSGTVIVHASRLAGAGAYEVQTTLGDPTQDTGWSDAGTFTRCSKIDLNGFTPGKMVSVRMRGIGSHSPGAWTPAASLMVV